MPDMAHFRTQALRNVQNLNANVPSGTHFQEVSEYGFVYGSKL